MKEIEFKTFDLDEVMAEWAEQAEFQATLDPWDSRHEKMYRLTDDDTWVDIYWSGRPSPYQYEIARFERPEDLIWFLHHVSQKSWGYMTGSRVGKFIETIGHLRNWPMYGIAQHPNEAPKPNHDKIGERQKMSPSLRYEIIKRDGYRCRACGFSVQDGAHLHVDHIVAVANGGRTERKNLQTLCTVCNLGKGAS